MKSQMKLELADFPVKDARFGRRIGYQDGVLEIDKDALVKLILEDKKIERADLDVVFPGEQTRVLNVRDVVEPRIKTRGPGCVFPGIMGPVETVGRGRTHRLSGLTVMPSVEYRPTTLSGTGAGNTAILDMWGPGAQITPFGSTINIILIFKLVDGVSEAEAHNIILSTEMRVANRLAEVTKDCSPQSVEVLELFPADPTLPRVVYVAGFLATVQTPHSNIAYYGWPVQEALPTFVHPNEFFDGAITTDARKGNGGMTSTWAWENQPVVRSLFREHGKRLNFLGVIIQRTRFLTEFGKKVSAACASQLATLFEVDAAIITGTHASGSNFMDSMATLQAFEKRGIKTVLVAPERGGRDGIDPPLLFYVPEATAMVSTGSYEREIELPVPSKVIGIQKGQMARIFLGDPAFDPWRETKRDGWRDVVGGIDWFGNLNITCKGY